jgi:DNA-directed RNA polymerase specialized sigma subunit
MLMRRPEQAIEAIPASPVTSAGLPAAVKTVDVATAALARRLRRAPRPSEISAWSGIPHDTVVQTCQLLPSRGAVHVDQLPLRVDADLAGALADAWSGLATADAAGMAAFPPSHRAIGALRFFGGLTTVEIAVRMGLCPRDVEDLLRQLLTAARAQARPTTHERDTE